MHLLKFKKRAVNHKAITCKHSFCANHSVYRMPMDFIIIAQSSLKPVKIGYLGFQTEFV